MKYLQKVIFAASLAVTSLAFTSFSANAVLITQNIYIDVDTADAGNVWGISLADSGLFGTIQYDPTKVVAGGIITPEDDPSYSFSLALGGLALSMFDDVDFGFGGPIALTNPLDALAGIDALFFNFDNGLEFGQIAFDYFEAVDGQFNLVSGALRFGDTTFIPEPSMLLLVLGGIAFAARRRVVA